MIEQQDFIKIGRLQKSYGIKGEIVLFFDKPEYSDVDTEFYFFEIDANFVPFLLEEITFTTDNSARAKFEDIENETQASRYSNLNVYLLKTQLPQNSQEEIVDWNFFVGYKIEDQNKNDVGTIENVDENTVNALFLVKKNSREYIIPATTDFITEIESKEKTIHMNLPKGLISEDF